MAHGQTISGFRDEKRIKEQVSSQSLAASGIFSAARSPATPRPIPAAAEFRGASDLALYWLTDWDAYGSRFGLEHALGTDPLRSDRHSARNLTPPAFNPQGEASVTFGVNFAATPGTIWKLTRSTDLLPPFTEILRFDGEFFVHTDDISVTNTADSVTVLDKFPPFPKAFYRFEAISP